MQIQIQKRNGSFQALDISKIVYRIDRLIKATDDSGNIIGEILDVDANSIALEVCQHVKDKIKSTELDEITAKICADKVLENPAYNELAKRLVISNNHKCNRDYISLVKMTHLMNNQSKGDTNTTVNETSDRYSKEYVRLVNQYGEQLDGFLDFTCDYRHLDYFGYKTLERSYLVSTVADGHIVQERPQHLWMRVALEIHRNDIEEVIKTYHRLSEFYYIHATPTLFNSGHHYNQLSSCYLLGVPDSIEGLYETLRRLAHISKHAGGIGCWISDVRGQNAPINSCGGRGSGLVPYIRGQTNTTKHVNQGGKRPGSAADYMEPWHPDIFEFLELRKNNGAEEFRARDIFTALVNSGIFMRRIKEAVLSKKSQDPEPVMWSLMCPKGCPGLTDAYGEEFDRLYQKYESEGKYVRQVNILDLWHAILDSQIETGVPYMLYKDAMNQKSNQKNLGTIKSSNLCVTGDTTLLTYDGLVPIRNLEGKIVRIWNGFEWSDTPVMKTGTSQELLEITFSQGYARNSILKCTPYHKFYIVDQHGKQKEVEASELAVGDTLIDYQTTIYNGHPVHHDNDPIWVKGNQVVSTRKLETREDTFCVNEPKRHMAIFNGILTGNCAEIIEYSSYDEIASCNLASISLPKYVNRNKPYGYDLDLLAQIAGELTRNLNCVIDRGFYPLSQIKRGNLRHRPIGIGVQGLADVFFQLRLPYDSQEAQDLNILIAEAIYYGSVRETIKLAQERSLQMQKMTEWSLDDRRAMVSDIARLELYRENLATFKRMDTERQFESEQEYVIETQASIDRLQEKVDNWTERAGLDRRKFNITELRYWDPSSPPERWGSYSTFEGSPASDGLFHFDLSDQLPSGVFEWDSLKQQTNIYGWRNSLLVAFMPTLSTSQIMGNNECFEPITNNTYSRTVLTGTFMLVNKYLQNDLMRLGLWKRELIDEILRARGSIQNIPKIPKELRELYKTSWELSKKTYLKMARDRGCFIDQSQSLNLFIEEPTYDLLTTIHLYGWELGLKTGLYYLRRKPIANAQQFSVEATKVGGVCILKPNSDDNDGECLVCSA